jgi:hypothetical protein
MTADGVTIHAAQEYDGLYWRRGQQAWCGQHLRVQYLYCPLYWPLMVFCTRCEELLADYERKYGVPP